MRKPWRKSWWAWLQGILLLCLIGLTGCQQADAGVVHLTLWQGISPASNRAVFQELVADFNRAHPDIEVESLYIGQPDQQIPKILTAVVGNAAPDILWYVPQLTGQLVELEALQPLDDWWQNSPLRQDIDPALMATMELEGHIWSVPFATNNAAVFYRPSLFEAAGIKTLPSSWEDLRQAARQLTRDRDGNGRIDQHGIFLSLGKEEWTVFTWLPFVYGAGGWLSRGRSPDLVNAGAIAALEFAQTLVKDGSALLSAPERGYEIDDFLAGKAAMQVTGPWTLPQMRAAEIDYGVFPLPAAERRGAVLGGENFFLCQTTPAKTAAAKQFLEYVLSPEFQLRWALGTGYLPINLQVRSSPAYRDFVAEYPSLNVFLEQMQWAQSRPIIPGYPRISLGFGRAIEASLLGQSPRQALATAQARLKLAMEQWGRESLK